MAINRRIDQCSSVSLGLYPPRAKLAIQRHVSLLSDNEQADIFERVQVTIHSLPCLQHNLIKSKID